ncbi:fimbrial protein [Trinickia mobilis]|uniref:fimbrial protein n=1 Tax=Trinickia mobilis TaxID=2816356 RepID=UPI001A8E2074|nr:fimbrial protein [Trinickia mobilis]
MGSVSVPSDAAIGSTLKTVSVTLPGVGDIVTDCPATTYLWSRTTTGALVPGYSDVYSTNLAGVGYKIRFTNSSNGESFTSDTKSGGFSDSYYWYGGDIEFSLIKTGSVTGGSLTTGQYGYLNFRTPVGYADVVAASFEVVSGAIKTPTCTATGPLTVKLGNISASTFNRIGTTSSAMDAKIAFTGCNSALASIAFAASGNVDGNDATLFALSGDSTAKGVGIELLDKDGANVPPNGTVDWTTTQSGAQGTGYAFKVRYKQTQNVVAPGTANGAVTINIGYR